jgi:methylglyoxal/glyoxal reductase
LKYRHAAWKALEKFQEKGLIRSIGVSNFMVKHLEDLKKVSDVVPALNQVEWHPWNFVPELHDYCKKNNILLQAYSSLGTSSDSSLRQDPNIMKIAKALNKSPSQVLLRWANQNEVAIIPKASSKIHLEENFNLDFVIPERDMEYLNGLNETERFDWNPNGVI